MLKSVTAKLITAVAAAALVAGLAVSVPSVAPEAKAESPAKIVLQPDANATDGKSAGLPVQVKGPACSEQSWPNYDPSCQFDLRRPDGAPRTVRVIVLR